MILREITTIEDCVIDAVALHPLQSSAWWHARMEHKNGVRFGVYDGDRLTAVFQMTLHRIPYTKYFIAYCPRSVLPSDKVLGQMRVWAKSHNVVCIKFEPDVRRDSNRSISALLTKSLHPMLTHWNQVITIDGKASEQLLESCDQQTRYNIRLASRKGVTVTDELDEQGFDAFFALYEATQKRQGYHGHDRAHHYAVYQAFRDAGLLHIFVARYQNIPLAACVGFLYKGVMYYPYQGTSVEHRNVKAPNLALWSLIEYASKHGASSVDLWGSLPPDHTGPHPWRGFTDFKRGYGGGFVELISTYDLVVHLPMYIVYTCLHFVRQGVVRVKKMIKK